MAYRLFYDIPTAEEFVELRLKAGMSPRDIGGARKGLFNSNFMVIYRDGGKLIGMGRIIGDGATTFQIADMAVDPAYQGQGLGKSMMGELVKWLEVNASPGSYVSLIADGDASYLYEKFGFVPSLPLSQGMHRFINKKGTATE